MAPYKASLSGPPEDDVEAAGLKVAARLLASSSSACFLACACRSLQVNFFGPPAADAREGEGEDWFCCSNCANRFVSFLGAGREIGVYAVPCFYAQGNEKTCMTNGQTYYWGYSVIFCRFRRYYR